MNIKSDIRTYLIDDDMLIMEELFILLLDTHLLRFYDIEWINNHTSYFKKLTKKLPN